MKKRHLIIPVIVLICIPFLQWRCYQFAKRIAIIERRMALIEDDATRKSQQMYDLNKAGMLQARGGIALAQEIEALRLDIQRLQRKTLLPEQPSELKSTYQ